MVDRSDPIAASAYSRSSSRDCSSRSSLRRKRGSEAPRLQNRNAGPHHSLGLRRLGIRTLLPKMGRGSTRPSPKASGPPCSQRFRYHRCRRAGPPLGQGGGPPITDHGNSGRPLLVAETGEVGATSSSGASAIPTSGATGGSAGESATAPAGVDAGVGNRSGGLRATAALAISSGTMAAPTGGSARGTCPMATRAAWAPRSRALCAEASQPAWCAAAPAVEASPILRTFLGARPVELCLRLLKEGEKTRSRHTEEKKTKQRYPRILTHSGPGPIVPVGRPLGPRPSQVLPRVAPLPTLAPPPPRAPEAPKERPPQASSRWPKDQLHVQPARATALGGQADRPDSLESPQLPRPRGQVPPRPIPAPRTGTLMSRPQILMAPAHLEAGSATPGPASDPG
jgi:hypothetical protein